MKEDTQETYLELLEEANELQEQEMDIYFDFLARREELFDMVRDSLKKNESINKALIQKAKKLQKNIKETQSNLRFLAQAKRNLEDQLEILKY